jgi:hypothetical protein
MDFVVDRRDLRRCRFVNEPSAADAAAAPGQAVLRIEKFAFTANNVTYGAVGEMIGYWKFFPAEEGWGRIPVWGVAVVEEPGTSGLRRGERVYGYFPMSERLVVEPTRVGERGFVDGAAHRRELPPVYNQYARLSAEPGYDPADDDMLMLLRPLFATAFLLDDFLAENAFFGASSVLLASASSKTASSLAYLLAKGRRDACRVVGLTSPRNVAFVERLGCYDRVVPYPEIATLPAGEPVVLVDMAGNQQVTRAVHEHFGANVKYSCSVGLTHWEKGGDLAGLPGATPTFFFAPSQIEKRTRDWGADGFQSRLGAAWREFLDGSRGWLRVVHGRGSAAVERAYLDTVDGRVDPAEGLILSLHNA